MARRTIRVICKREVQLLAVLIFKVTIVGLGVFSTVLAYRLMSA